jgi:uncharacterized repeat protein (TIGR01451 family)
MYNGYEEKVMLSQLDSQNLIGRPAKLFLSITPHGGEVVSSAILLSVMLTAISLFCINWSAGGCFLGLHPSSQIVSGKLRSGSPTSSPSNNVPLYVYSSPLCGPDLSDSFKSADRHNVAERETLTYTIVLVNTGDCAMGYVLDMIPSSTVYVTGSVQVSSPDGVITDTADRIEWMGIVQNGIPITITFPVTIARGALDGETVLNTAWVSYADTTISRTVTVTVDADRPDLWECAPSGWVTTTQTPTCTVQARDLTSGLDIRSAGYRYSTNGGVSWSGPWSADCSGESGTTLTQTITAANVPFEQASETMNLVEFRISDMISHTACYTCTVRIDTTSPTFGSFRPKGVVTTTRTPTCTIVVSDVTSGLDMDSASYQYSNDEGKTWSRWISATCSGSYGTKEPQLVTALAVPFSQNSPTSNLIRFRINDVAGNLGSSVAYSVPISVPYAVYLPVIMNNYTHPLLNGDFEIVADDFAVYWERQGILSVSITTALSNGDPCSPGTYCALLGSPSYPCKRVPLGYGRVCQIFGVPSAGPPTLSFWYRIFSYDELNSDKYDSFDVYIDDIFDEAPRILLWRDGSTDGKYGCEEEKLDITDWKFHESDLSAISDGSGGTVDYRGKTVQLCFSVHSRETDPKRAWGWYNTWAYVDNVRIEP